MRQTVTVGAGIVLFTVTNVDDILLLAAFFADSHLSAFTFHHARGVGGLPFEEQRPERPVDWPGGGKTQNDTDGEPPGEAAERSRAQ